MDRRGLVRRCRLAPRFSVWDSSATTIKSDVPGEAVLAEIENGPPCTDRLVPP